MKDKYTAEPRRNMTKNFTERTLARSKRAKTYGQRKDFTMNFIKKPAGAFAALAILLCASAGGYAAVNWFNGQVLATQKDDILSVDLTGCKNAFMPGFSENQDMSNVQFKILGTPHISEDELEQKLLLDCEFRAVLDFYQSKPETAGVNFRPGKIVTVKDGAITLEYSWGGETKQKDFAINNATLFNQGNAIQAHQLSTNQHVVLVTQPLPGDTQMELRDPLDGTDSATSIFVTQYDMAAAPMASKNSFTYDSANIMPIDIYNSLPR